MKKLSQPCQSARTSRRNSRLCRWQAAGPNDCFHGRNDNGCSTATSGACRRRRSGCQRRRCLCWGSSCRRFRCAGLWMNSSLPIRNWNEVLTIQWYRKTQQSYWQGFQNPDMVWHRFANGLHGTESRFIWRDKLVCMQVCESRELGWIGSIWLGCLKKIGLDFGRFGLPLVCHIQTMQTITNHYKPIGEVWIFLPPDGCVEAHVGHALCAWGPDTRRAGKVWYWNVAQGTTSRPLQPYHRNLQRHSELLSHVQTSSSDQGPGWKTARAQQRSHRNAISRLSKRKALLSGMMHLFCHKNSLFATTRFLQSFLNEDGRIWKIVLVSCIIVFEAITTWSFSMTV